MIVGLKYAAGFDSQSFSDSECAIFTFGKLCDFIYDTTFNKMGLAVTLLHNPIDVFGPAAPNEDYLQKIVFRLYSSSNSPKG